jgi:Rieske Fe-S protein
MSDAWKNDFPVTSEEESYVARREFTKFMGLTSIAFFLGTVTATARKLWRRDLWKNLPALRVAKVDDLAVGGYKLFRYPTQDDPCILLRLKHDKFTAFNQHCTHLECPVYFKPDKEHLVCPCHNGIFSATDGSVIAGPPKRPLDAFAVSMKNDEIWIEFPDEETT